MADYGIIYAANSRGYIDEVLYSYGSLRLHMPDAPVTIISYPELYREVEGVQWQPLNSRADRVTDR